MDIPFARLSWTNFSAHCPAYSVIYLLYPLTINEFDKKLANPYYDGNTACSIHAGNISNKY